jgi:peptidoglycan/xylan/chitin deacetylase (PgdA/CDA1 family)
MCKIRIIIISLITLFFFNTNTFAQDNEVKVPILLYHRVQPTVKDSMTITINDFEAQMKWLKDNGYNVIPLKTLMAYLQGKGNPPPAKSVVITSDDGHESVYQYLYPVTQKYHYPVTLFIYPSAISNASYAMTWNQLEEMKKTGLFDIQSHTYWHPNFNKEKKRLSPIEYDKFVDNQLAKSKAVLEKKFNIKVEYLAWPFGIYNEGLEKAAAKAGYTTAFTIDARHASRYERMLEQPRYMIVNGIGVKGLEAIVTGHAQGKGPKTE